MVFEKKVIVGSIASFLGLAATVIGVVAIFFPDTFNLQKEKMPTIAMAIQKGADINKFEDFMLARALDGKIFRINVKVCNENQNSDKLKRIQIGDDADGKYKYGVEGGTYIAVANKEALDDEPQIVSTPETFVGYSSGRKILILTLNDEIGEGNTAGNVFAFPPKISTYTDGLNAKDMIGAKDDASCPNGDSDYNIRGYAVFSGEAGRSRAVIPTITYNFEEVSEKEVKLKNY